jgi:large subunit ribosomal protein L5
MMVAQTTAPRLKQRFADEIAPKVQEQFGLTNVNQLPKLAKITISVGIGKQLENQKLKPDIRDSVISTLTTISGQKPIMIRARKSVANFKVREGAPSSFMVTLRRGNMWHFLDRLINLACPRIKDFRGLKTSSFDRGGSYSFGLTEQAVWPEINMANVSFAHGMNINIVFEQSSPEISDFVLRELGFPLIQPVEKN